MNPCRHTSLWIPAISIKSHNCQNGSNGYNALHNAMHNCNQSQHCTIDIFLIGTPNLLCYERLVPSSAMHGPLHNLLCYERSVPSSAVHGPLHNLLCCERSVPSSVVHGPLHNLMCSAGLISSLSLFFIAGGGLMCESVGIRLICWQII